MFDNKSHIYEILHPNEAEDGVKWIPSPDGKFSTSHTCDSVPQQFAQILWYHLVWFKGATSHQSFILRLAINNNLMTESTTS